MIILGLFLCPWSFTTIQVCNLYGALLTLKAEFQETMKFMEWKILAKINVVAIRKQSGDLCWQRNLMCSSSVIR